MDTEEVIINNEKYYITTNYNIEKQKRLKKEIKVHINSNDKEEDVKNKTLNLIGE